MMWAYPIFAHRIVLTLSRKYCPLEGTGWIWVSCFERAKVIIYKGMSMNYRFLLHALMWTEVELRNSYWDHCPEALHTKEISF